MRQIVFRRTGPPSVLELEEVPDLTPGPGEVRIAVEAAGVNFADLMARMGVYPDAPPLPSVVGYEVAGTVDAVGDGVDPGRVGEPVVALTRFGGYATQVVVAGFQAVRRPDGLGAVEGAGIPVVGLTAWMLCEVMGRARAGDRVLVHSAAGGVGLAALDLLKWRGATAVGTASAAKHERLLARGYDQLVDYRTEDFEAVLAEGPGFDLVLDPVGGASWAKGLRLLRPGGRLGCFGFSAMAGSERRSLWSAVSAGLAVPWLQVNPVSLMNANKGVFGVNMGHLWDEGERVAGWLAELLVLWEQGVLRPHVHGTFPFDDVAGAHALLHGRGSFGKVVLVP
ncbi:MAG: zinc-binding dehydrogenase [Alphaproteobacteria bacterium]|nr:zinc-binding dehydrogenase [Alphaproteobacteria bacterium]MCB9691864.1 zinc-binding dehydrogenase [Alphaproteobacteria bacterium]